MNVIKGLPQFVPQPTCLSCDGCCRFSGKDSPWRPKMAREEINKKCPYAQRLLKELDEGNALQTVEHRGHIQCAFLSAEDNLCRVYEHRPFECRLYPFLLLQENGDLVIAVHLQCPYIQEKRKDNIFGEYVSSLKEYVRRPEVLGFLKRNPMLAGDYAGYEQEIEHLFPLDR
ncbi:MAG: YkgJ family cysteine cluster protein [Candidatus Omnitrophica bacterium]|nr:YkgJ family cysteine cluster protein [Candidatus Omnitrophota bacterium]